jgi:hypothetical protein
MTKYHLAFHEPTSLYVSGFQTNHRNELCAILAKDPILFPARPVLPDYSFEGTRSFYTPYNEFTFQEVEVNLGN